MGNDNDTQSFRGVRATVFYLSWVPEVSTHLENATQLASALNALGAIRPGCQFPGRMKLNKDKARMTSVMEDLQSPKEPPPSA